MEKITKERQVAAICTKLLKIRPNKIEVDIDKIVGMIEKLGEQHGKTHQR